MSTEFTQDPYGYEGVDVYTFDVNFDKKLGFDVSESSSASQTRLDGEWFVLATPDEIFGPYATKAEAEALLTKDRFNSDESMVFQLSYP
ncbi:hypothetical protein SynSYN20_01583 [Synechococcus sp. SYN20]|uniref:hypothetical protein n=1 Tax=Synechococcus sp. SYN20 TaxID=1050714 RepID=UPI0016490F9D|nr:hypothetical protein [Synechococcus sp. SYN20]QNJ25910.1 hypothetical protein SynSYN20_01583 [Synechococcus sp. SYN20]